MMKTSIFALAVSSAAAFSSVIKNTNTILQSTTQLSLGYISGPEGGLKHKPFGAPGHFETIGSQSAAERQVINGEEIHEDRSSYATATNFQHFSGEIGFDSGCTQYQRAYTPANEPHSSVYEPFVPHSSTGAGDHDLQPSISFASASSSGEHIPEFVPHSSTGAGGHDSPQPAMISSAPGSVAGPVKTFAPGSWSPH